ncbi:hypothetical protein Anapl_13437 [Anas platyrhynchos]|uniref:Uncharacterized protein n=1 Tax=Anas platyrhynchos TaxID=8839 RepID=R0LZV1_ANAPL|nr:hypothetical protein Anapl_13437 [Anas platyrhynchos]
MSSFAVGLSTAQIPAKAFLHLFPHKVEFGYPHKAILNCWQHGSPSTTSLSATQANIRLDVDLAYPQALELGKPSVTSNSHHSHIFSSMNKNAPYTTVLKETIAVSQFCHFLPKKSAAADYWVAPSPWSWSGDRQNKAAHENLGLREGGDNGKKKPLEEEEHFPCRSCHSFWLFYLQLQPSYRSVTTGDRVEKRYPPSEMDVPRFSYECVLDGPHLDAVKEADKTWVYKMIPSYIPNYENISNNLEHYFTQHLQRHFIKISVNYLVKEKQTFLIELINTQQVTDQGPNSAKRMDNADIQLRTKKMDITIGLSGPRRLQQFFPGLNKFPLVSQYSDSVSVHIQDY